MIGAASEADPWMQCKASCWHKGDFAHNDFRGFTPAPPARALLD